MRSRSWHEGLRPTIPDRQAPNKLTALGHGRPDNVSQKVSISRPWFRLAGCNDFLETLRPMEMRAQHCWPSCIGWLCLRCYKKRHLSNSLISNTFANTVYDQRRHLNLLQEGLSRHDSDAAAASMRGPCFSNSSSLHLYDAFSSTNLFELLQHACHNTIHFHMEARRHFWNAPVATSSARPSSNRGPRARLSHARRQCLHRGAQCILHKGRSSLEKYIGISYFF